MNQPDSSAHVAYLRHLGVDLTDLRSTVLGVKVAPGRPALHTLSTLFYGAQGLAARLAAQVTGLAITGTEEGHRALARQLQPDLLPALPAASPAPATGRTSRWAGR